MILYKRWFVSLNVLTVMVLIHHAVTHGQWAQREQEYRHDLVQRMGREIVVIARKIA